MQRKQEIFFLILILLIASFFRFFDLGKIPPGLHPDEAINGNEAYLFPGKIFYPENNGREGLYINLIFLSFKIFGPSTSSIRAVSAFFGILTVLGLYLLAKEVFYYSKKKNILALLCSFFLAISFWHTNFSRIGFRGVLLPFILVFFLYFLLLGIRQKTTWLIICSGVFFGLGFHTYSSFRLAPLFLLGILIYLWFQEKWRFKKFLIFGLKLLLPAFLVALPLGIYFLFNPSDFFGRLGPISIFAQENIISAFRKSLSQHLLMFNLFGDKNWRHNISGSPQLFWPIGIFFLVGLAIFVNRFHLYFEEKKLKNGFYYFIPLLGFFVFLLAGVLTYQGIPHSLRTIGTIPFVYLFSGFGSIWTVNLIKKITSKYKFGPFLLKTLIVVFFLFVVFNQANRYFVLFAKNKNVEGAFCKNFVEMGKYLATLPENIKKYVVVNEEGVPVSWINQIPMPAQTLIFQEIVTYRKIKSLYIKPEGLDKIKLEKNSLVLLMREDEKLLEKLKEKYPEGKIKKDYPIIVFELL
ncbi:MAG: glycosyltransferase family 39 protein [Candidatus Pacebacteria bacterium]|nr:glycosyltransferase family 39 protein [Candidatus Paceibacterota bacterium]